MFTGIVQEKGCIKDIADSAKGAVVTIECCKVLDDIQIGESISVNGICSTVTTFDKTSFTVEYSLETINRTNFKSWKKGLFLNLEKALKLSDRINGHLVSGHIDSKAKFIKKEDMGFSTKYTFEIDKNLSKYVVEKGSITINGISLTVAEIKNNIFSVVIIPQTLKETNINELKTNDYVNIETDMFAKYTEKILLSKQSDTNITMDLLKENGFA